MDQFLDGMQARLGSSWAAFNPATLLKNSDLTPSVQRHMMRTYATLAVGVLLCSVGGLAGMLVPLPSLLSVAAYIGLVAWFMAMPPNPKNSNKRHAVAGGAAVAQGLSLGPLLQMVAAVDAGLLATAFVGSVLVFACFSMAALLARRRSYLFLTGTLSSVTALLLALHASSMFFRSTATLAYQADLFVGLALFLGYVLVDTQVIIEKASNGERDSLRHALQLLTDLVAIFVRLLVIMLRNAAKREQRQRRDGRDKHAE